MGGRNKALLELGGRAVLAHVLETIGQASCCLERVVVMNPDDIDQLRDQWGTDPQALGADKVVAGGAERWISSALGTRATRADAALVLVHDAARALVDAATFDAVADRARSFGAALAAEPLADTLKREAPGGCVAETIPRESLWRAQTPQGARREILLAAIERWEQERADLPTDESMLLEAAGHPPSLVTSSSRNLKLTTPNDLALARALLASG